MDFWFTPFLTYWWIFLVIAIILFFLNYTFFNDSQLGVIFSLFFLGLAITFYVGHGEYKNYLNDISKLNGLKIQI